MTAPLFEMTGLSAGYDEVRVLHDVTLSVRQGSITALVGSNGAGKTTLMRTAAGLLAHQSGTIRFDGTDIGARNASARVALGLALVPEGRMIFPEFTVEENLRAGAFIARARANLAANMNRMFSLFPRLRERRHQQGVTLSGGEQQMLALARGLMSEPRLLLLDEPSLGLAPNVASILFESVAGIRKSGVTVLMAEQDIHATLAIADFAHVLENGRVTLSGSGDALLGDSRIKEAYLGA